jgi:hypothetical protein
VCEQIGKYSGTGCAPIHPIGDPRFGSGQPDSPRGPDARTCDGDRAGQYVPSSTVGTVDLFVDGDDVVENISGRDAVFAEEVNRVAAIHHSLMRHGVHARPGPR